MGKKPTKAAKRFASKSGGSGAGAGGGARSSGRRAGGVGKAAPKKGAAAGRGKGKAAETAVATRGKKGKMDAEVKKRFEEVHADRKREVREQKSNRRLTKRSSEPAPAAQTARPDGERREILEANKKLWQSILAKKSDENARREAVAQLAVNLSGHAEKLYNQPLGARYLCVLAKYGDDGTRAGLVKELTGHVMDMCKNKYGYHVVYKLFRYATGQREVLVGQLKDHVLAVMRVEKGSVLMDRIYPYLSREQVQRLSGEFYGPYYEFFLAETASSLADLLRKKPEHRTVVMGHLSKTVRQVAEKQLVRCPIVHHVLADYVACCSRVQMAELVEALRDVLAYLIHTQQGASVAFDVVTYGTAADRKHMVKAFKGMVGDVARSEEGYGVLLRLLDVTDDTQLLTKGLLKEVLVDLPPEAVFELGEHPVARRVLAYLLNPRSPSYVPGPLRSRLTKDLQLLKGGEPVSKKDDEVRQRELRQFAQPKLLAAYTDADRIGASLKAASPSFVLEELLKCGPVADRAPLETALALSLRGDATPLLQPAPAALLKRAIKADGAEGTLALAVLDALQDRLPELAAKPFVAFLVLALVEHPASSRRSVDLLRPHSESLRSMANDVFAIPHILSVLGGGTPLDHPRNTKRNLSSSSSLDSPLKKGKASHSKDLTLHSNSNSNSKSKSNLGFSSAKSSKESPSSNRKEPLRKRTRG